MSTPQRWSACPVSGDVLAEPLEDTGVAVRTHPVQRRQVADSDAGVITSTATAHSC